MQLAHAKMSPLKVHLPPSAGRQEGEEEEKPPCHPVAGVGDRGRMCPSHPSRKAWSSWWVPRLVHDQ